MKPGKNTVASGTAPVFDETFAPAKNLSGLVGYWRLTSKGKVVTRNLRFAPDECMEIFFDLHPLRGKKIPMLSGLLLTPLPLRLGRELDITGIKLYPGTFYALFGRPSDLFTNRIVPLEAAVGKKALPFSQVFSAKDIKHRISLIDSILSGLAAARTPFDPRLALALGHIANAATSPTVRELAELTGWTQRWFSETFKKWIGVPPRSFCNSLKFKEALVKLAGDKDQISIAHAAGYSDQAHLIRSFKDRTGHTPAEAFQHEAWRRKKVFLAKE